MMNFVHAPTGAIVTVFLTEQGWPFYLALIAAFLIHFVLDAVPHFDPVFPWPPKWKNIWPTLIDMSLALGILVLIFGGDFYRDYMILWGAAMGIMPDVFLGLEEILRTETFLKKLHRWVHHKKKMSFWGGMAPQIIVLTMLLWGGYYMSR